MALFGIKKKEEKKEKPAKAETFSAVTGKYAGVLLQPRVTEKAALHAEKSVYTFDISLRATKEDVINAVRQYYSVRPVKVAIATFPPKKVSYRGKPGVKSGGKKAYVYLKKGETIEFV